MEGKGEAAGCCVLWMARYEPFKSLEIDGRDRTKHKVRSHESLGGGGIDTICGPRDCAPDSQAVESHTLNRDFDQAGDKDAPPGVLRNIRYPRESRWRPWIQ